MDGGMKETGMRCSARLGTLMVMLAGGFAFAVAVYGQSAKTTAKPPSLQDKAWEILRTGAHERDTRKRAKAIRVLGLMRGDLTAAHLAEDALKDKQPEVRAAAAAALGDLQSRAAIPALQSALDDLDLSVSLAASRALVALHDNSGYDIEYAILTGKRKNGVTLTAQALTTLHDPNKVASFAFEQGIGFVPYAGYGLDLFKALASRSAAPARAAAAAALEHDPDPRTGHALTQAAFDKDPVVRAAALEAIAQRGDPRLLHDIEPALSDHRANVQYVAAAAILRLSSAQRVSNH
jgi:HEAT repeat protein